jgi:hypothetical protein
LARLSQAIGHKLLRFGAELVRTGESVSATISGRCRTGRRRADPTHLDLPPS